MAKYLIPSDKTLKAIKPDDERKRVNDGEGPTIQSAAGALAARQVGVQTSKNEEGPSS